MTRIWTLGCLFGLATLPAFAAEVSVTTVADLYTAVSNAEAGDRIVLDAVEFVLTETLALTNAVTVAGTTDENGKIQTVLRAPKMADFTAVDINHAEAVLEKVDITGINFTDAPKTAAPGGTYTASAQWRKPLCVMIQTGTLRDATIRDNTDKLQYAEGVWLWMSGGTAERVRVTGNNHIRNGNLVNGYAVYVKGSGRLVDCEIDNNICNGECNGAVHLKNTAQMIGGSVHHNDGQSVDHHGGLYVADANVLVEKCRIYGNNNGLYMGNGTVRNCLVYGNRNGAGGYGGARLANGKLFNCTIADNVTAADTSGLSGLQMTGGTAENNIIWGNGPDGGLSGSLLVTGGNFNSNLTDKDAGRGSGNVIGNPFFADATKHDYALTIGSAARDIGKNQSTVTDDFVGTTRPQGAAPDAGAYEYVPGDEPRCAIRINEDAFPLGSDATVTAVLEGTASKGTLTWYVDGALTDQTGAQPVFSGLAPGHHTIRLVVTVDDETYEATVTDAIAIRPATVYVSKTGSATYPYATVETATADINAALATVYSDATTVGRVNVAAGIYYLSTTLSLASPVEIVGAGRDETIVSAGALADTGLRGAHLAHPQAVLRALTLTGSTNQLNGCGVYLEHGTLDGLRVTRSYQKGKSDNYNKGSGVYMTGGVITNALIDYNFLNANYANSNGLGIWMSGGTVVDSEICYNWMARGQHYGLGISAKGGTIRRCRIHDNESTNYGGGGSGNKTGAAGHGVFLEGKAVLEDSLIYSNGVNGVVINSKDAVMRNCLVYGHRKGTNLDYFAGVNLANGTLVNCTITDNCAGKDTDGKSGLWQTGGTAVNNIVYGNGNGNGEALQTGSMTSRNNLIGEDPKFVHPSSCNFRLRPSSPAIDAGDDTAWTWSNLDEATDLSGRPRRIGAHIDLGCYEWKPSGMILLIR